MKKLMIFSLLFTFAMIGSASAHTEYKATEIDQINKSWGPRVKAEISQFVEKKSLECSGKGAGIHIEYSCSANDRTVFFCSFAYPNR